MTSKHLVRELRRALRDRVLRLKDVGVTPRLVVIRGELTPDSESYLNTIRSQAKKIGIEVHEVVGDETDILDRALTIDPDGVLPLRPLREELLEHLRIALPPELDVDCITYENMGLLFASTPRFLPATPLGVLKLLRGWNVKLEGARVAVIGRSLTVGKPLAIMLINEHATVTVCHSRTRDLQEVTRGADVIVVAAGKPELIGREHVKEGAVVVDVGVNEVSGELVGDVRTDEVLEIATLVSPVKGGVGPLTTLSLLENVVTAAERKVIP